MFGKLMKSKKELVHICVQVEDSNQEWATRLVEFCFEDGTCFAIKPTKKSMKCNISKYENAQSYIDTTEAMNKHTELLGLEILHKSWE